MHLAVALLLDAGSQTSSRSRRKVHVGISEGRGLEGPFRRRWKRIHAGSAEIGSEEGSEEHVGERLLRRRSYWNSSMGPRFLAAVPISALVLWRSTCPPKVCLNEPTALFHSEYTPPNFFSLGNG
jgi:hypothetical protein